MLDIKIISKVTIKPISEDVITKLLTAEIARTNPELTVNEITYERKLNPNRMVAIVDAQIGSSKNTETNEPSEEAPTLSTVSSVEEPDDKPLAPTQARKKVFG